MPLKFCVCLNRIRITRWAWYDEVLMASARFSFFGGSGIMLFASADYSLEYLGFLLFTWLSVERDFHASPGGMHFQCCDEPVFPCGCETTDLLNLCDNFVRVHDFLVWISLSFLSLNIVEWLGSLAIFFFLLFSTAAAASFGYLATPFFELTDTYLISVYFWMWNAVA